MTDAPLDTVHRTPLPDGGHLAHVERGEGPPLVLLHGGVLDHRMWAPQLESLGTDHRVIAVDARGHGWSSTPAGPFRLCDDLAVLIEALDLAPVTLVGISMGAGTATDTALEHPDLVGRLVVSGAGTSEPTFTDPWILAIHQTWQAAGEARDKEAWIEAFLSFSVGPGRSLDELGPILDDLREMATRTVAEHIGDGLPIMPTPVASTWERIPGITIPVLGLPGTADSPDHVRMTRELVELVPDGRVVEIEGTGHYPNLERPEAFDAALREFLDATA